MKATTCRVNSCDRPILARVLCAGHYSRWRLKGEDGLDAPLKFHSPKGTSSKPCAIAICTRLADGGRGMCAGHYARWLRSGDAQPDVPLERTRKTCLVGDCDRPTSAWSYCNAHSQRIRRNGTVDADRPLAAKAKRLPGTACTVPDCGRRRWKHGMCAAHYRRWDDAGQAGLSKPVRVAKYTTRCTVEGCEHRVLAKNLCRGHYWRQVRTGDVRKDEPIRVAPAYGEPCTVDGCPKTIVRIDKCSAHYQAAALAAIKADPERHEAYKAYHRRKTNASRQRDPEGYKAKVRAWRQANPATYRAAYLRRKLLLANAAHVPYSKEQLEAKMAYWGNRCWVCGGPFEAIDHVKPLSRGGAEILANLRPICTSDNSSKNANWPWSPTSR